VCVSVCVSVSVSCHVLWIVCLYLCFCRYLCGIVPLPDGAQRVPPADFAVQGERLIRLQLALPTALSARPAPPAATELALSRALLEPLQVRFRFHFMSSLETARPDRPDWYLSQVRIPLSLPHTLTLTRALMS
jgi:hypothetical protein